MVRNSSTAARRLSSAAVLFLILFSNSILAADVELLFFYRTGCPHSARVDKFLKQRLEPNYAVAIEKYEIHKSNNANLLLRLADAYNSEKIRKEGVPAVFVGSDAIQGDNRLALREIEVAVRTALHSEAPSPLSRLGKEEKSVKEQLTLPALLIAAGLDAINPCTFGVLALLLATITLLAKVNRRKRVIHAGLVFTVAVFICYTLMGFGLLKAIQVSGIQQYVYWAVGVLAILIGLWNTKDYFWHERGANIEVPKSWQPKLKKIVSGVTSLPGCFFTGVLCSLFLLPCTSGPYVVIIGMLSNTATRTQAVWLLLLYNAIFVIPFIIITVAIGLGLTTTARLEMWRQKRIEKLHLASGIFMLALGVTLVTLLILGII